MKVFANADDIQNYSHCKLSMHTTQPSAQLTGYWGSDSTVQYSMIQLGSGVSPRSGRLVFVFFNRCETVLSHCKENI